MEDILNPSSSTNQALLATLKELIRRVNLLSRPTLTGPGCSTSIGPLGVKFTVNPYALNHGVYIAEVDSVATGGGYYNCHLQTLDATDWDSATADQVDDTGDSVIVLNIAEIGSSNQSLDADDKMLCWNFIDDEGNTRYIGVGVETCTVVTDIQWDTTNSLLQKKTRTVYILANGAESAWTTTTGGTGTVC